MRIPFILFLSLFLSFYSCKESSSNTEPETVEGLVWSDEFDGEDWDRDEWIPELGASGWGNQELQNYTASDNNIEVSDGTLKIIARKIDEGQDRGDYTSARLTTKRTFGPGTRIEIRAKMPAQVGNGLWPAIWMLGDGIRQGESWPDCGEIDIMEYVSYNPNTFYCTIHSNANNHIDGTQIGSGDINLPNIEEEFNTFGIVWEEDFIQFFVNEVTNAVFRVNRPENPTLDNWPFSQQHFLLLNMAVGGSWGGAQGLDDNNFPATFEIDYVRVYALED